MTHKRTLYRILAFTLVFLQSVLLFQVSFNNETVLAADIISPVGPDIYADAAIVMEANTGAILYQKDIYSAYYPASITKIMTALLALENCALTEIMTMSKAAENNVYGRRIGLVNGESVTMEQALYGILLSAGNEVTYGVAEHVSGSDEAAFVDMMNARAASLNCVNTHFANSHGLHDDNHYVCAYDVALICQAAIALPDFRKISGTRTYTIPATNKNVARPLANNHKFIRKTLTYEYAIAGMPGETSEALNTLVTFAEKDGLLLICVLLHEDTSDHSYEDTIKLCNFAFENYKAMNIKSSEFGSGSTYSSLFSDTSRFTLGVEDILSIDDDSIICIPNDASFSDVQKSVTFTPLSEFSHGNNTIGKLTYTYGGTNVGSADIIYYNKDYPITAQVFDDNWPTYLVPIDVMLTTEYASYISSLTKATPTPSPSPTPIVSAAESELSFAQENRRPLIIGGAAALITLLIGSYIVIFASRRRR